MLLLHLSTIFILLKGPPLFRDNLQTNKIISDQTQNFSGHSHFDNLIFFPLVWQTNCLDQNLICTSTFQTAVHLCGFTSRNRAHHFLLFLSRSSLTFIAVMILSQQFAGVIGVAALPVVSDLRRWVA